MGFLYSQLFITPPTPTTSYAGQTIVVTGANSGLGLEAARHFVRLGATKVILAVRNLSSGEEAKASIEESTSRPGVCEVWSLDLASYPSIQAFATRLSTLPRLDILLENAGVAAVTFEKVVGHERNVQINVISTFLLAFLALPKLQETASRFGTQPRLTVVASEVHAFPKFEERKANSVFEAIDTGDGFDADLSYPLSKLLEVLIVRELAPKVQQSGVILNMCNPGLCHSGLSRDSDWRLALSKFFLARTAEVGSRNLLAATAGGSESSGCYFSDGKLSEGDLSGFVRSEEGKQAQVKVWRELKEILEGVQAGVTEVF